MFSTLGRQPITLSQIDVATGEMYILKTYVMVKVRPARLIHPKNPLRSSLPRILNHTTYLKQRYQ